MSVLRFPAPEGYHWIFRPYRTLPDGTRQWAREFGKRAFRFLVKDD
jgi:hypothetical protein